MNEHFTLPAMRRLVLLATLILLDPSQLAAQQPARPIINGGLPSVSPHGDAIAFTSNRSGTFDVYVTSPDGAELLRITNTPAMESAPAWTADARVIFSTWADNVATLFAASSRAPQPVAIGTAAGRSPAIAPDGKRLLFSRGQFPSMHLVEAALDGSNTHAS